MGTYNLPTDRTTEEVYKNGSAEQNDVCDEHLSFLIPSPADRFTTSVPLRRTGSTQGRSHEIRSPL